jgi:WD40 repeat protein
MNHRIFLMAVATWILGEAFAVGADRPVLKKPARRLQVDADAGVPQFLTFSPDGRRIAGVRTSIGPRLTFTSVGSSSQVFVWNAKTGRLERSAHAPVLKAVQFSPAGDSLVGLGPKADGQEAGTQGRGFLGNGDHGGQKYRLLLWRLNEKTPLAPAPVLDLACPGLHYDPAGPMRAEFAGSADAIAVSLLYGLRIWKVASEGRDIAEFREDESRSHAQPWAKYHDVRISADGSTVIIAGDGGFSAWDCASRERIGGWAGRKEYASTLYGLSSDGTLALVELAKFAPEPAQQLMERMAAGRPSDPQRKALERLVCLVSTLEGEVLDERPLSVTKGERVLGWTQNGTRIVTVEPAGALRVVDLAKNTVIAEGAALGSATVCAALSQDGATLVTASTRDVAVWNLPQAASSKTLRQHQGESKR